MPYVASHDLDSYFSVFCEYFVLNIGIALEPQHRHAIMGKSCTELGLSVGCAYRSGKHPTPTHMFFYEDALNKNRRRMIPRTSTLIPQVSPYSRPSATGGTSVLPWHTRGVSRDLEPTPAFT